MHFKTKIKNEQISSLFHGGLYFTFLYYFLVSLIFHLPWLLLHYWYIYQYIFILVLLMFLSLVKSDKAMLILSIIIHKIFSPARKWCYCITWPNIPQLKRAKKISRIINTVASTWHENMLGYLSVPQRSQFLWSYPRKAVHLSEKIM